MIASILIIGCSLVLLVYWFRYSCILLLRDRAVQPTASDSFSYTEVMERLRGETRLDLLHSALDRDYRVLTYLLEHAAGLDEGFEDRLLMLDYELMRWWYRLTKSAAPAQARAALSEMASILAVLGRKIGAPPSAGSLA